MCIGVAPAGPPHGNRMWRSGARERNGGGPSSPGMETPSTHSPLRENGENGRFSRGPGEHGPNAGTRIAVGTHNFAFGQSAREPLDDSLNHNTEHSRVHAQPSLLFHIFFCAEYLCSECVGKYHFGGCVTPFPLPPFGTGPPDAPAARPRRLWTASPEEPWSRRTWPPPPPDAHPDPSRGSRRWPTTGCSRRR